MYLFGLISLYLLFYHNDSTEYTRATLWCPLLASNVYFCPGSICASSLIYGISNAWITFWILFSWSILRIYHLQMNLLHCWASGHMNPKLGTFRKFSGFIKKTVVLRVSQRRLYELPIAHYWIKGPFSWTKRDIVGLSWREMGSARSSWPRYTTQDFNSDMSMELVSFSFAQRPHGHTRSDDDDSDDDDDEFFQCTFLIILTNSGICIWFCHLWFTKDHKFL